MSIKKLFDKENPYKILSAETLDSVGAVAESSGNVNQRLKEKNRFIPVVNFDYPENFARYGKASKYYEDAITRIYDDYPYDGSLSERAEYRNESSYLDLYILDQKYPRRTGHAVFSPNGWGTVAASTPIGGTGYIGLSSDPEYVLVKGGPNQAPAEYLNQPLHTQFDKANIYDPAKNRKSNLKFDLNEGLTVEFWMDKEMLMNTGSFPGAGTSVEIPFMLSNENSGSMAIYVSTADTTPSATPFSILLISGSTVAFTNISSITNADYLNTGWHHFAFALKNVPGTATHQIDAYLDGTHKQTLTSAGFFNEVTGALQATIGAGRKLVWPAGSIDFPSDGYGKLSGSIDEFRYWKTARNAEQIGKYWFTQYGGGTNAVDSNTDLGVYYKFNEGIVGNITIDSTVLDYSGRISNGDWTGYSAQSRLTSSAIDIYLGKKSEFTDPIIYSSHPAVVALKEDLLNSGSVYDLTNNASIYNSIPSWITEEDELGSKDLANLTQIMASYFDTLQLQLEALPRLKDKTYNDPALVKPHTFSSRLLESQGFVAPEIFADADVMAQILNRDADRKFELDLYDIKNVIYQNVYNNLTRIYKSKGTEKSFRNLIRCFGVDEDLVRLNIYGNNVEYELKDNYRTTSEKKKYADFNHPDRFSATVYQQTASSNPNSVSYITGSSEGAYLPFTVEAEVIFPKKLARDNINYFATPFLSSSLFGFHGAPSPTDFTWPLFAFDANLQVYAVREELESDNLYFQLVDRNNTVNITTPIYDDAYDNQKWNLAIRFRPEKLTANRVSGSGGPSASYIVEFYGINSDAGIVNNEFLFTASMNAALLATSNKRLYLGAHRLNFTGSTLQSSDAKISSLRYWASYLTNDAIKAHSRDPSNHGSPNPYESTYLYPTSMNGITVPQAETLALNWDFSLVTSSDGGISGVPTISDAGYPVSDISSGSTALTTRYGWLGKVIYPQHTGRGDFYIPHDTKATDTKFVYSGKTVGPEVIQSSDMINILGESDLYFDRETRPVNFFYSIEKSMYQTISDEMLKMFSTIKDFSNLIGAPVNRYRPNYKAMEKLRNLFFENVENTPNLDKYVEFYKWIDSSLNIMLQQLVPMSADVSDEIRTMVESHVLERNKYQSKFPSLEFTPTDPTAGIQGINKLLINWKFDHHPLNNQQNTHCRWWKTRARRDNPVISSGNTAVDAGRQKILEVALSALNRRYTTPLRLDVEPTKLIHGGNNVKNIKGVDITRAQLKFGTTQGMRSAGIADSPDCLDKVTPDEKIYKIVKVKNNPDVEYLNTYAKIGIPWTIISSSLSTGLGPGAAVVNNHRDIYGPDAEVPMQGPFTDAHVGGLPFRHVPLNRGTDNPTNRMEGWDFSYSVGGFISRTPDQPRGPYYRDETAKRPVNIRNIKGDYGNYTKDHQVVQSAGRFMNNKAWVSASGWDLEPVGTPSYWVAGLMDTPKIQRGRHESIMVSRFNAPGGPDTMGDSNGGAGLDRLSAEYSFNNDLNSRNWNVRSAYYPFLTSHVNQFGYFSNYGDLINAGSSSVNPFNYAGTGSIYQVNRNTLRRMQLSGTTLITGSQRDNFWIQHAIPRSDLQYSWVNASYETAHPSGFGYWHENLFNYVGLKSTIFTDTFSGTLGSAWSQTETTQRQSTDSTNWLVRLGQQVGSSSIHIPRKLELDQDIELPFAVTYGYAQGQYENRGSRVYSTFGPGRTVLSSSGQFVDTSATTNRFSISCWFKPTNLTTNQNLFTWDDTTSGAARARIYVTANSIRFSQRYTPLAALLDARWVHAATASWTNIVLTHDMNAAMATNAYPTLYINGVSASLDHLNSTNAAGGSSAPAAFESFIMAGRDPNNISYPDHCYTGSLDNVIWYNELFDPTQVAEIYNDGLPKSPSNHSFYQPNVAVNDPNHYWQLGDANADKPLILDTTGAPYAETEGAVYDWNALGNPYESTFWALATLPLDVNDFQMVEYDGYNMQQPQGSANESLSLQISYDAGTTWETASIIPANGDFQGKDTGIITQVTNFYSASPGQQGRIRFYQTNFGSSKKDNWAIDNVTVTRTHIIEPVTFSPYGDFSSRYYTLGPNLKYGNTNAYITADANLLTFVPTVYTDLNYNVYEPVDVHNQSYGYPLPALTSESERANYHPDEYLNTTLIPDGFANNLDDGVWTQELSKATLLNSILIKRNGPYGYPTWKQIRTGDHAIARSMRKNNLLGCTPTPGKRIELNGQQYIEKYGQTTICTERPVNSSYSTLDYLLGLRVQAEQEGRNPEFIIRPVHLKTTYGNNLSYFTSEKLNVCADYDKVSVSSEPQAYDTIKALYLDGALNDPSSPVYNLVSLKYAERVYPAAINSYSGINRTRTDYLQTFWRTFRDPRNTLGALKFGGFNSQGLIRSQSCWALDACTQFGQPGPTSAAEMEAGVGLGSHYAVNYASGSSGELQNDYTFFWTRSLLSNTGNDSGSLKPSPIYSRKQGLPSLYSVVGCSGMQTMNTYATSTAYLSSYEHSASAFTVGIVFQYPIGALQTMGGNAKWEAGPLAGTLQNQTFVSGASSPFQNDYAAYNAQMVLKNKQMSVIPEFRISEHMPYYFNEKGGDFLADNTASLTLGGTPETAGSDDFYKTYSYSDFMKFFEVIDDDHAELDDLEKTLTLKCSALKKFLPYDGFYPAERTLEIASLFSSSYASYVTASGDPTLTQGPGKMRPLYATLFAPGVLYNTIKSGIAVDYPAYTGSFKRIQVMYSPIAASSTYRYTPYVMLGTGSRGIDGWDTRVTFENLLEPEQLNDQTFVDMEANANAAIASSLAPYTSNLTASLRAPAQQNLYKLAINNFTAETSDFFLRKGLTTIRSDVSDSGYTFQSGTYSMRFKMYRSMNGERKSPKVFPITVDWYEDSGSHETITMYSRPTAFGPPVAGSDRVYSAAAMTSSIGGGTRQQNSDSLYGKNPSFTPPYYDGESWCDIILDVPQARVMTLDDIFISASVWQNRIPKINDAWPNNPTRFVSSASCPMHRKWANNFAMQITSSMNMFRKEFTQAKTSQSDKSARWVIQPKFETPILNFGDQTARPLSLNNVTLPSTGTAPYYIFNQATHPKITGSAYYGYGGQTSTPIGMWHQFGLIPQKEEGIYITLDDVPDVWLNNVTSPHSASGGRYPTSLTSNRELYSLADVVGFRKGVVRKLGRLAQTKTVSEGLVAIPYVISRGERKFFQIDRGMIQYSEETISNATQMSSTSIPAGASIVEMVRKMKKFILPPKFDFVRNSSITPFAMYIFEFTHTFSQDDLSYMWQNLMPKSGTKFEEATAQISHKIMGTQLLEKFKDRVRWMVFKVKQRGNNNYYSILAGGNEDLKEQLPYSYNWPYDYFSLIEFAQIDSQIEYSTDKAIDINESFSDVSTEMQKGLRATKELTPSVESNREATARLSKKEQNARQKEIKSNNRNRRKNQGAFKTKKGDES